MIKTEKILMIIHTQKKATKKIIINIIIIIILAQEVLIHVPSNHLVRIQIPNRNLIQAIQLLKMKIIILKTKKITKKIFFQILIILTQK
jgi:hypothetical protein